MESIKEIADWIKTLDPSNSLAIDDGGLILVEIGPQGETGNRYEIGGIPLEGDDE